VRSPPRLAPLAPRLAPLAPRLAPALIALAASVLAGCNDEQFRELMTALLVGFVAILAVAVCMGIINLTILGGGIATIAIHLVGTPTERSRILGFVFGGLNLASGLLGLASLVAGAVYVAQMPTYGSPGDGAGAITPSGLESELPTLVVMSLVSLGSTALGVVGIVVAARAKVGAAASPPPASPPPGVPPNDAPWG
jgi:hypothetical protein